MTTLALLRITWVVPFIRSARSSSLGQRSRSLVMALGFGLFLALLSGIFRPILTYFWAQEAFGQVLVRGVIYFLFLALGILTIFSAVIAMSSRFFTAGDAELFLSRPVAQSVYFRFRYWQGTFSSSWMLLPFWLPFLLALKKAAGAGWGFFLWGVLVPLPLGWIACSLAAALVMAAARRFSAKRLRNSFVGATAFLAVGLILLLRLIQPEKLTRPDSAVTLAQFIQTWSPSARLYDPVALATDGVLLALSDPAAALMRSLLLWSLALALYGLLTSLSGPGFLRAWLASRELMGAGGPSGAGSGKSTAWSLAGGGAYRRLWLKEISGVIRSPVLRLQMLLVAALSAIFLFSLFRLPLQDDPGLREILFLPSCGFSQLILISVATRFIFPMESVEAQGSWMLRSAPLTRRSWLLSRLWIYAPPLLALNALLILSCIHAFAPDPRQQLAALSILVASPLGIAALTSYLGLAWKQQDLSQVEDMTTGPAAVLVMSLCVAYVVLQLGILYLPLREFHRHDMQLQVPLRVFHLGFSGLAWLLLQGAAIGLPMALASGRMQEGA